MFSSKSKFVVSTAVAFLFAAYGANAQVSLTDGNAYAEIDPDFGGGMYTFEVDGIDQLYQQWFWYRYDGMQDEMSINNLSAPTVNQIAPNIAGISYNDGTLKVEVFYLLTGGTAGSGTADIAESIRITNVSGSPLNLSFFQYSDFDLMANSQGDSVTRENANTIRQSKGPVTASEVVSTPAANHWEIGGYPSIISKFFDGSATTLSDSGSPFGPGDGTFAWQWDRTLGVNGSFLISKDKRIEGVPEPASMIALGTGLVGLALRRRRK